MAKSVSREKDREKSKPTKSGTKPIFNGKAAASAVKAAPAAKPAPAVTKAPAAKASAPAKAPAIKASAIKAPTAKVSPPAAKVLPPAVKVSPPAKMVPVTAAKGREAIKAKEREAVREAKVIIKYKCPFPAGELKEWRQVLLSRRGEITDDIEGLVKDAMDAEDGHTTPNHIAERGSDADLQDMSLGVVGEEKEVVWQIDRALRKIDAAKPIPFGLCEYTKEPIPKTRLQLIPWTPLSIEGATHMEKNALTLEDLLADE